MPYGHNKTTKNKPGWQVRESRSRPADIFERVDLNPAAFDRFIQQKGVAAKVYRTTYCPKVKSVDGAEHEIDCNLCNGSGFIDLDPICTFVFVQAQELDKMANVEGMVDGNTVLMTFPIGIELQYFTKVEIEDFTDIFIQRVMRAPETLVDVLKYRASRVNILIDYDGVRYFQDQDFKIDQNGNILWMSEPTARKPADNKPYSIHFECSVQYRATMASHVNRYTQTLIDGKAEHLKLPEQWYCRKEFLVKRTDKFTGDELQQGPYDNHEVVETPDHDT